MKLADLDRVQDLSIGLALALSVLDEVNRCDETVPAFARGDFSRFDIPLPPVPKSLVLAAAQQRVDDIRAQLAGLGVQIGETINPDGA